MVPALSNATIDNVSSTFRLMEATLASTATSVRTHGNWPSAAQLWEMLHQWLDDDRLGYGVQGLSNATFAGAGNPLDALARQQVEAVAQAWRAGLFGLTGAHNADGLTPTVMGAYRSLMSFGPRGIDLRGLNVYSVNSMHLAAILRCTHSWRGEVPGWREALAVACQALERSGLSVEDAVGDLLED